MKSKTRFELIRRLFLSNIAVIKTIVNPGQGCEVKQMTAPVDAGFEKKRDLILFVLKQVGQIEGRTRFQKIVFLAQKELGLPTRFDFSKHYYGPYSKDLSDTIETLISQGDLIEEVHDLGSYIQYNYKLPDPDEAEIAEQYTIDGKDLERLKSLGWAQLGLILAYVYQKYCPKQGQMGAKIPT